MAASSQTTQESNLLGGATSIVDVLSKGIAGIAIALYGCGFLIVSLHHSQYGFAETNPFRPRILAAGAWFLLFAGIPSVVVAKYRGRAHLPWTRVFQFFYPYYIGCYSLAFPASALFEFSDPGALVNYSRWGWFRLIGWLLALGVLVLITDSKKVPAAVSAITSVFLTILLLQSAVREFIGHHFGIASVTFWFFAVGVLTLIEVNIRSRDQQWHKTVIPVLGTLLLFAQYYYPPSQCIMGWGTPV